MSDDIQRTALRVPKALHAKIIESAKKNNRTMNAEIVERLDSSFSKRGIEESLKAIEDLIDLVKDYKK